MQYIKNFANLATTPRRKHALAIINSAFAAISPQEIMKQEFTLEKENVHIKGHTFKMKNYKRVFLIGFGKGSSGICKYIEGVLGDRLTAGYDIDVVEEKFKKITFTLGTHPLPSQTNIDFTDTVLADIKDLHEKDLVLVIICGGGSALFESPVSLSLDQLDKLSTDLLRSGATISEMNVIRKHISKVKGGGLAKHLYPATVASLIFSDVPGNNLAVIASGPTVPDSHSIEDSKKILEKYKLMQDLQAKDFEVTPTDEKYFSKVTNILMVSNINALQAMRKTAEDLGYKTRLYSDRLQGDAKKIGKVLINQGKRGEALFAGGETTMEVTGHGKGGRNQSLVLASLPFVGEDCVIAAFDSDGWDFFGYAGAIGDSQTVSKASKKHLDIQKFLDNDDSYTFFQKVGDGIDTGKLESNVSDLMFVLK